MERWIHLSTEWTVEQDQTQDFPCIKAMHTLTIYCWILDWSGTFGTFPADLTFHLDQPDWTIKTSWTLELRTLKGISGWDRLHGLFLDYDNAKSHPN